MHAAHRWLRPYVALIALAVTGPVLAAETPAAAAVFPAVGGATYKEYWVPHSTWTGGCPEHGLYKPSDAWYIEPGPCVKTITFTIPDDVSRVAKVEMYLDLWRNYTGIRAARVQLNNGPVRQPPAGYDWSRSPVLLQIPVGELRQGVNTLTLSASPNGRRWHLHDVAFRVHHDAGHPLVAGPGSDVTPPTVALTGVRASNGTFLPAAGGTLQVGDDRIGLTADASGASRVEFHAFYDGYDTDNDGQFTDWQGFSRNNWNPGGARTTPSRPATGSTVGVPGIDVSSPYDVTWSMPEVINQSGVKFKARAVDAAGNVRESAASGAFTLSRPVATSKHLIPNFVDLPIHINGMFPDTAAVSINLPSLTGVTRAYLIGHYWQNPFVQVNGNTAVPAFPAGADVWQTSVLEIPVSQLRAGANTITYRYNAAQISYGQFVERPGPMIVLRGGSGGGGGGPTIVDQPDPVTVAPGERASFAVGATTGGTGPLSYQWRRNGVAIPGATTATYTTAPVQMSENGAEFDVVVTSGATSVTSNRVRLTVAATPPSQRRLTVTATPVLETDVADGPVLVVKLSLDRPATTAVTAILATAPGGTATSPTDFWPRTPTVVSILPGQKVGWFGVRVRGDRLREANETVVVTLSGVVGATISSPTVLGTVIDDD